MSPAPKKPTLDEIDRRLTRAARLLDCAASKIRDAKLDPKRNVRRLGEALVLVFEIQHEIYRKRPDLMPQFLKPSARRSK